MGTVSRKELAGKMAAATGLTLSQSDKALVAAMDSIKESLSNGDNVTLIGFGTFTPVKTSDREGRNPSTGEKIMIKAKTVPKFKAGTALKEAVNK